MARAYTLTAALLFAALPFSQPATALDQRPGPWIFTANAIGVHQSEVDMNDTGGSFYVDRWFVNGGVTFAWSARTSLGIVVGGGKAIYEFDGNGAAGGDWWSDISDTRVSLVGRIGFGDTGVLTIVPTLRDNAEDGAGSGDGQTYGLFAAVTWRLSEELTIGPGIGVFSRLEDGTRAFPLLAIDWDISDRWNLATGNGVGSSQGPGLTLNYKLNDDWSFGLTGRYEDLEFRLDNKAIAPGGVGRDQAFPLVVSAALTPNPRLRFSVFAGASLLGKLEVKSLSGNKIESDYDPALLAGVSAEFRF